MTLSEIERVGVVGAGTMGAGIAQVAAQTGFEVLLYDIEAEIVERAKARIAHYIDRLVEKGRLPREEAEDATARISTTTTLDSMQDCGIVIEAAPEILSLKQQLFEELDRSAPGETILATNTSTLSVTQIGAMTSRPERVVGMHFFNPPPLMPLVEVVRGAQSAEHIVDLVVELARSMGKRPVRVADVPGFIVNRVARPFHLEGLRLLEQGVADAQTIDRLYREAGGFRMGPFELQDLIGIDINYAASRSLYDAYEHAPRFRPSVLQRRQLESGNLGKKTGRGWYTYDGAGG